MMSRSANYIAESIIDKMRLQGEDVVSIPWNKFYILINRERIQAAFMSNLKTALKRRSFLLVEGQSVVAVMKDFNFKELN